MRVFAFQSPRALFVFGLSVRRKWGAALQHPAQIFPNPDRWLLLVNTFRTVPHSERTEPNGAKSQYSVCSFSHHALSRASRVAVELLPSIRRGTPPPLWMGLEGGCLGDHGLAWVGRQEFPTRPTQPVALPKGQAGLPSQGQRAGHGSEPCQLLSSLGEQGVCIFRAGLQGLCKSRGEQLCCKRRHIRDRLQSASVGSHSVQADFRVGHESRMHGMTLG